jgi:hypothetical protein
MKEWSLTASASHSGRDARLHEETTIEDEDLVRRAIRGAGVPARHVGERSEQDRFPNNYPEMRNTQPEEF